MGHFSMEKSLNPGSVLGGNQQLAESGAAVMLTSSDMPEVLHLANRVYVMHRGRIAAELEGANITEEVLLLHFFDRTESDGTSHSATVE